MVCSLWVLCFCCLVEASELSFTFNGDIIPLNNQTIVHLTKAITLTASLEEEDVTGQPVDEHANVSQGVEYRWIINHVTVYYTETDTMTFSNGIPQLYLNRPMGDIGLSYHPYYLATSNEFPANEIIEVDKTVGIQETFWSDISNNNFQQIFYNNLSERHEYHVYRNRSF